MKNRAEGKAGLAVQLLDSSGPDSASEFWEYLNTWSSREKSEQKLSPGGQTTQVRHGAAGSTHLHRRAPRRRRAAGPGRASRLRAGGAGPAEASRCADQSCRAGEALCGIRGVL